MDTINQSQLHSGWVLVGCMIWEGIGDGVIRVQWAPALCSFLPSDLWMRLRGCLAVQIKAGSRSCLNEEALRVLLRSPASGRRARRAFAWIFCIWERALCCSQSFFSSSTNRWTNGYLTIFFLMFCSVGEWVLPWLLRGMFVIMKYGNSGESYPLSDIRTFLPKFKVWKLSPF